MEKSSHTRFVSVPADTLLGELEKIGALVEGRGGRHALAPAKGGSEMVFDLFPHSGRGMVRVYTTVSAGASRVRACGEDAIRVVVGVLDGDRFRPLIKHRKILRTAPKGAESYRVQVFLDRLRVKLREAYREACNVPACPQCQGAMKLRINKHEGNDFWGCISYPQCRGTRPAKDRQETEGARA